MNQETIPGNAFADFMRQQRKGGLLSEASEKLQRLVNSVRENGKGGTLVIKLKVSPANGDGALNVYDDVELKLPKKDASATIFYASDEGVLQRTDPNQKEMQFAVVPNEAAEKPKFAVAGK